MPLDIGCALVHWLCMKKQRQVVSLSARQVEILNAEAARLGITISELLRRIIDQWSEQKS